jgi:hypothetical protein
VTAPTLVSIEERRYAALVDALKLALFALNIAPRFKAGLTDGYRIAEQIEQALSGANEACAYRKLKLGRSGDEVRPGWHVT